MRFSFRQRLFLYFTILFSVFTIGIAIFERYRKSALKTELLEEKLDLYTHIISTTTSKLPTKFVDEIAKIQPFLPPNLRITIIDLNGHVLYDNILDSHLNLENHIQRREIIQASKNQSGSDIRISASNDLPYLYYAKKYANTYIRVALPYNIQLKHFLQADNLFLYFLIFLLTLSLFIIHRITKQFGTSISRLRNFALEPDNDAIHFEQDEIGEIGKKIADNYQQLQINKKNLQLEKQKLLQHILISEEGICFISPDRQVDFHNGLFVQYLNQITENPTSDPLIILKDELFSEFQNFIQTHQEEYFETQIHRHGKTFSIRAIRFEDLSFEVVLTDITEQEKTKKLKQEMTGNIAHELRTPVTSIRAYLETVIDQSLTEDKKHHFTKQAYLQTLHLSEMIKDMSIIAKLDEAPESFTLENINLVALLQKIKNDKATELAQKNIQFKWQVPESLTIPGNNSLLISIFRNLIENSIRYAGENILISLSLYNEDEEYVYFSYYDTGRGIEEEYHLNRLFERFYRVQEGRARDTGGTGLGLSIVKNAVLFHKGSISVKNKRAGGLEFIFKLHK